MDDFWEKELLVCLAKVLSGNLPVDLDEATAPPENELHAKLLALLHQINEANGFLIQLANGNLHCRAPRGNVLLGSAKDLQSSLRHLLWQLEQVAVGDYSQKVEFLGDFSTAFNLYIEQVALRERYRAEASLLEKKNLEQRNRMLVRQLEQQLTYYETLTDIHQRVNGIKHDMKNHCFALNQLLSKGDIDGTQQYLNSIGSILLSATESVYNTGNPIFDALLTEKVGRALAGGIEINVELAVKATMRVENMDWCILLGNALDNAIEASEALAPEDRTIDVKMVVRKSALSIFICNRALAPVRRMDGFYESSKGNKAEHGLGLMNISQVVEKYHGVLQTTFEEGYFTLTCMLCNI